MEIHTTEQEQVEALKAWWDKHGKTIIIAIVAVLLAVLGWKSWQGQQYQHAANASAAYQNMSDSLATDPETAMELGRTIVGEYPNTVYATMASLAMGRIAVEQGDLDGAAAHLSAAAKQAEQHELMLLAHLRLSKVLLAKGETDNALSQLEGLEAGSFAAAFDEQRGDILLLRGDREAARDAYTNALSGYSEMPEKREMVQMKLNDLAEREGE